MKIVIDTEARTLAAGDETEKTLPLYSREAFEVLSDLWVKVGWVQKYSYTFTWMGRPFIQLPEDVLRMQEVIYNVKPDVIIETGVAHGGSLMFSASLCKTLGKGRVIGIDIEIRPANRHAIEQHFLAPYITLIESSSTEPKLLERLRSLIKPGEAVLVILDSCHTKAHVLDELDCYHPLVTVGSYVVATDGIMRDLSDLQRGEKDWVWDNPATAAEEFAAKHPAFCLEQPAWIFNESTLRKNITYWPSAFLRRVR